jgi:demethylmenaquinone methyltransferase/2-methoxy-6-polyprenyl-1,4-benzoquinol methylase
MTTQRFTLKIGDSLQQAETKRDYNERVFSEIAPRYDFITRALSFWKDATWKHELVRALPGHSDPVCLDLACGTGDIAFLLARKYSRAEIIGIDITEPMLELARQRNSFARVRFEKGDMHHLEAADNSIDIVTGGYALRNAPDLSVALDEIHRCLKPGGIAAFLDFSKPSGKRLQKIEYYILKSWAGFWGILFHGNHEVYSYIAESLEQYPDRDTLRHMVRNKGFTVLSSMRYFFGITETLIIVKNKE